MSPQEYILGIGYLTLMLGGICGLIGYAARYQRLLQREEAYILHDLYKRLGVKRRLSKQHKYR